MDMKSRILDISDCSESPLLGSSKNRHRSARPSATDHFQGRHIVYKTSKGTLNLNGLTEAYFNGPSETISDYDITKNKALGSLPKARNQNISYHARCAERWWDEFCRWFGSEQSS